MKPRPDKNKTAALTFLELMVVVAVLAVLAILFLPILTQHHTRRPLYCVNNLKQVGLSFQVWSGDNNGKYPFELSVTNGGTKELNFGGKCLAQLPRDEQ